MTQLYWEYWGRVPYNKALSMQAHCRKYVIEQGSSCLLLLEHDPTITIGRSAAIDDVLVADDVLRSAGIQLVHTDRGGQVTYHGPGQLVGYPIRRIGRSVRKHVDGIAAALIAFLHEYGIEASWDESRPGVWTSSGKIAAVGINARGGVTTHGFALNVDPDLRAFDYIVPCGTDAETASMRHFTANPPALPKAAERIAELLARKLGYSRCERATPEPLKRRFSGLSGELARSALCAMLFFGLALVCSCRQPSSQQKTLFEKRFDVQVAATWRKMGVNTERVRHWMARRLGSDSMLKFSHGYGANGDYSLEFRLVLTAARDSDDAEGWLASVDAEARPIRDPKGVILRSNWAGRGHKLDSKSIGEVRGLVEDVCDELHYQSTLATAPPPLLKKALRQKSQQRLAIALEVIAQRKNAKVGRELIELLHNKNADIRDRAIGAVVAIGDRSAVKHLTRLAKFSDPLMLAKIIDGVATLGGNEAESYLEFVSDGHPDESIREIAKQALGRLKKESRQVEKNR